MIGRVGWGERWYWSLDASISLALSTPPMVRSRSLPDEVDAPLRLRTSLPSASAAVHAGGLLDSFTEAMAGMDERHLWDTIS